MHSRFTSHRDGSAGLSSGQRVSTKPSHFAAGIPARSSRPAAPSWASSATSSGLEPAALLSLAGITELADISHNDGVLSVGANVTWARLEAFARGKLARDPCAHPAIRLTADPQCRHAGRQYRTWLAGRGLALLPDDLRRRARIDQRARQCGALAIKDFHTGPKQTVLAPDEIITRVLIPLATRHDEIVKLYKISKRKEMDVSTFRAGIRLKRSGEQIESAAIAYCGVGPTVRRLPRDRSVSGRPAVLRGDISRGGHPGPRRGRADLRRPRLARLPPAAGREHPAQVLSRYDRSEPDRAMEGGPGHCRAGARNTRATRRATVRNAHESAQAHVTGQAVYLDDLPPFRNELLVEFVGSPLAHGRIVALDVSEAAQVEGIAAVFTAADVPGDNQFGPIFHDEECWPRTSAITSASRSWCWPARVARPSARPGRRSGSSWKRCRPCCRSTKRSPADISSARRGGSARGDAEAALARAEHVIEGTFRTGGQEHFYLETQAALAIPGEGGQMIVHSSTQNPSEIQAVVAHCLGLRSKHGRLHLHADGGRVSAARSRRPPIPRFWRPWSPTRPAGRRASSTPATSTCG